jgi:hypothetical protein
MHTSEVALSLATPQLWACSWDDTQNMRSSALLTVAKTLG